MQKIRLSLLTVFVFAGAALLFVPFKTVEAGAEFGGACKNVNFKIRNGLNSAIEIKKVKFYNRSEGRWETENIKNSSERCNAGQTCVLSNEDLGGAEDNQISKLIFVYQTVNSNVTHESEEFHPTDPVCVANKTYGYGQQWTITQENSTTISGGGACSVKFKYTNGRPGRLRVTDVKYYIDGSWKTEHLMDKTGGGDSRECGKGKVCFTADYSGYVEIYNKIAKNQDEGLFSDLANAEGVDITKVVFKYKFLPEGRGQNWSDTIESKVFEPTDPRCFDGKIYGHGQKWTIGGDPASESGNSGASGSSNPNTNNSTSNTTNRRRQPRRIGNAGTQNTVPVDAASPLPNSSSAEPANSKTPKDGNKRRRILRPRQ